MKVKPKLRISLAGLILVMAGVGTVPPPAYAARDLTATEMQGVLGASIGWNWCANNQNGQCTHGDCTECQVQPQTGKMKDNGKPIAHIVCAWSTYDSTCSNDKNVKQCVHFFYQASATNTLGCGPCQGPTVGDPVYEYTGACQGQE